MDALQGVSHYDKTLCSAQSVNHQEFLESSQSMQMPVEYLHQDGCERPGPELPGSAAPEGYRELPVSHRREASTRHAVSRNPEKLPGCRPPSA